MIKYFLRNQNKIKNLIKDVYIITYNEDIKNLIKALEADGFDVHIVKTNYSDIEKKYSRQTRCLLNHCAAWKKLMNQDDYSMVVEADFVPVKGLSNLPFPFKVSENINAFGMLYNGSSRLLWFDKYNYPMGTSATAVAYILNKKAARVLVEFAELELKNNDPYSYFPWDTYYTAYLLENNINNYLPFRCYGEHGGIPNFEHKINDINPNHQADVLWGKLSFLPSYAKNNYLRFFFIRIKAKARGIGRLILNRYIMIEVLRNHKDLRTRLKLIFYSIYRLISIY